MDLESGIALKQDRPAVRTMLKASDGSLEQDPDESGVYWATMRPRSVPTELYHVRIGWSRYPTDPPSVKFGAGVGGSLNVTSAWPLVPGYRPGNFDICAPFTAEGYASHPEWATQQPWRTSGNPFLWVIDTIQGQLDRQYGGRST